MRDRDEKRYFSTTVSTRVPVDVEIELDDLAYDLDLEDLRYLAEKKGVILVSAGQGDPDKERLVEDAYRAALAMADCPAAFRELLWKVHGRAI